MHHLGSYNWGGILFVLGILPASCAAVWGLQWWSRRRDGGERRRKIAGAARVYMRRSTDWEPGRRYEVGDVQRHNALDSSEYKAPAHRHMFDLARSQVVLCEDRSLVVGCAMQGCGVAKTYPQDAVVPVRSGE